MRSSLRIPLFVLVLSVVLTAPVLAGEAAPADESSPDVAPATETLPVLAADVDRSVEPDGFTTIGIPDPVAVSDACNLQEGEYYWLCTGSYCPDGDKCAKKCSWATHHCCESPQYYCIDPSILCFE